MAQHHYDKDGNYIGRTLSDEEKAEDNLMKARIFKHIGIPAFAIVIAAFGPEIIEKSWLGAFFVILLSFGFNYLANAAAKPILSMELKVTTTTIIRFIISFGIMLYIKPEEMSFFSWGIIIGGIACFLGSLDCKYYRK